ncbi:MAG: TIGR01244 family phosphatase [Alphaproteobacteria bacterium HGW-Alphaproteobacteria-16]|nr:MAG: TIGR01244 family phosphatase [Alphaproteobacteria bacterium HGW-Alphaproteobacteria-16]
MADIRRINDRISVAPQIDPADVTELAHAGFVAIVNNRPDGEEGGQPEGEAVRAVAETLGLAYHAIPVTRAGFSMPQVEAMRAALDAADGPVLAYCRSGTRSANLWALAEASNGGDPATLIEQAAGAGYDLNGLSPTLDTLSGKA